MLNVITSNTLFFPYCSQELLSSVVELWFFKPKVMDSSPLNAMLFFKNFFNESGKIAGKFKGDKNSDEKFYQRFSKVLFVLVLIGLRVTNAKVEMEFRNL